MKEAIVDPDLEIRIVDSPTPEPNADQVIIRVIVSGTNPKDWKMAHLFKMSANSGDDIAGIVHKIGAHVTEFKPGDRVAALHMPGEAHGSYAEYAVSWAHTTFHLPNHISFEEGATIPLAALTAAAGLYLHLNLTEPWCPRVEAGPMPLVIYGASSAVGAYAVQLARQSNIHPLICVAGKSQGYVESLIDRSKGDTVLDYREGDLANNIEKSVGANRLSHVFEAVSADGNDEILLQALGSGGKVAWILQSFEKTYPVREDVEQTHTNMLRLFAENKDFGHAMSRHLSRALQGGNFKPHPHKVVEGGLSGLQLALSNLMKGKASGFKYVIRINETEGLGF
ncbi:alcohol dehydrogenase [Neofusicoccum parvum]|nr:alcohol dehydrogenase [Neofusicoccum parvum]